MFILTETYKAVQNSDSAVIGPLIGITAAVCLVLLVCVVVDGMKR